VSNGIALIVKVGILKNQDPKGGIRI